MLTIQTAPFVSALSRVAPLCGQSTMPILTNVLLRGEGEGLLVSGNNGDMSLQITVPSEGTYATTLPAARLLGISRELSGQTISLGAGKRGAVAIKSGSFESQVSPLPVADFLTAPAMVEPKTEFRLPVAALRDALRRTVFAASEDQNRFVLCGVHLVVGEDSVTCVATDGKRLAMEVVPATVRVRTVASFTIPKAAVVLFLKAVAGDEGDVGIRYDGSVLLLVTSLTRFTCKVMDATFPNWQTVIPGPAQNPVRVSVARDALLASISRTTIIDLERLVLTVKKEALCLSTAAATIGGCAARDQRGRSGTGLRGLIFRDGRGDRHLEIHRDAAAGELSGKSRLHPKDTMATILDYNDLLDAAQDAALPDLATHIAHAEKAVRDLREAMPEAEFEEAFENLMALPS